MPSPLQRRPLLDWFILGGFAIACALLCWLEFRWTGELAQAEHLRLQDSLTRRLTQTASDLDNSIRVNVQALVPEANQLEGRDAAAVQQQLFTAWRSRDDYRRWFTRVAVVIPQEDSFEYRQMDLQNGQLTVANWPAEWADFRDSLLDGAGKGRGIPRLDPASNRLEFPVFGPGREERQWLLFDLDEREIAAFLEEALGPDPEFRFELRAGGPDGRLVYPTGLPAMGKAEAMRPVLNLDEIVRRRGPGGPPRDGPFHEGRGRKPGKGGKKDGKKDRGRFGGETSSGKLPGRWVLLATASSGPIATLVAQHRWFNFGVAALLAIVLFGSALALLRYTRRAQQVAAMQFDFLTGVTHELRTPLTVIRTAAHNLERDLIVDRDRIRKYATLIRENGEHLTSMVEQILEYARRREQKDREDWEPVDLAETVQEGAWAASGDIEEARAKLEMHLPDAEPLSLPGDRLALVRLAQNLIANAARHGGSGGIVEVDLTRVGDTAQLIVSDRGPGMTPEELENAFTAFYRGPEARLSRSRGTGLGLSLVDEIVRAHGGSIILANRAGGGLTATVRLPLALNPGDAT